LALWSVPNPAMAQCQGLNNPFITGPSWGWEGANVGTCDNDTWYYGWVADKATDGYCVQYFWKDDYTSTSWNLAKTACSLNVQESFHYQAIDHDSVFQLCKQSYTCATTGVNWGF